MTRASRVDGVRFSNYPPTSRGRALFVPPLWGQRTPMKDSIYILKFAITKANLYCHAPRAWMEFDSPAKTENFGERFSDFLAIL